MRAKRSAAAPLSSARCSAARGGRGIGGQAAHQQQLGAQRQRQRQQCAARVPPGR
jgi:hypothetical protein